MHKIVTLWGVPRSTSTAFFRMMANRGDMTCLLEPFGEVMYYGEHPRAPAFKNGDETRPGLTTKSMWEKIQQQASQGPVFMKDFPHYINHMWTPEFLSHFTHAFLIRHPGKTIPSYFDRNPNVFECELGFSEQRALFDLVTALNHGTRPPVIDSDDLLDDPEGIAMAFCEAVDIPHIPEALTWDAYSDPNAQVGWYQGGEYHQNLLESTQLTHQKSKYVDMADMPATIQMMYRRSVPHYEHLYQYRLSPKSNHHAAVPSVETLRQTQRSTCTFV